MAEKKKFDKKYIYYAVAGFFVLIVFIMLAGGSGKKKSNPVVKQLLDSKYQTLSTNMEIINKKLDERITKLEAESRKYNTDIKQLQDSVKQLSQQNQNLQNKLDKISSAIEQLSNNIQSIKVVKRQPTLPQPKPRITSINLLKEVKTGNQEKNQNNKKENKTWIKLPDGSIVRGTIISGILAPVSQKRFLPTLITVDEAFYGPNNTRVPLKNCKIIAEAQGDYTTQRAEVKLDRISCVFPNGEAKSFKITGWVSDTKDSTFGIQGRLISVTGKYVAGSFLTSFLSGLSGALSRAETTNTVTSTGASVSNITGNTTRYAAFAGSSAAFAKISAYYQGLLDKMVDMIYVPSGRKVWVFINKGVVLKGYSPKSFTSLAKGVD